jgi:hypothetical protein
VSLKPLQPNPNGPSAYSGDANINIPGIGSGQVFVQLISIGKLYHFGVTISQLPGQTQSIKLNVDTQVGNTSSTSIDIPGIGNGLLTLN